MTKEAIVLTTVIDNERTPSNSRVDAFLERLEGLSTEEWLRVGAAAERIGHRVAPAAMLVNTFATQSSLCFEAWMANDAVTTIGWSRFAGRRAARWSRAEHDLFRQAIEAARAAAVALCARDWVADTDFASVYLPLESAVPLSCLGAAPLETPFATESS